MKTITFTHTVEGNFGDLIKALEEPDLVLPQDAKLEVMVPKLRTYDARSRLSRAGRRVYGVPRLGPRFFTTGGKLERRRVRSRLAALARRDPVTRGPWKFIADKVDGGPSEDGTRMEIVMDGRSVAQAPYLVTIDDVRNSTSSALLSTFSERMVLHAINLVNDQVRADVQRGTRAPHPSRMAEMVVSKLMILTGRTTR